MGQLRYVTIPEHAQVVLNSEPWSFIQCFTWVMNAHPSFNGNGAGIRASVRLVQAFDGKKPGDVVTLDDADWKLLHEAFESPALGLIPPGLEQTMPDGSKRAFVVEGRRFMGYLDAVGDEQTKQAPKTAA